MSIMRKVLDSKVVDCLVIVSDITVGILTTTAEVLCDALTMSSNNEETKNNKCYDEATYEYFRYLTNDEQQEYFRTNEYLNRYYEDKYIYQNRDMQAMKIAEIAYKMNRSFTNKYNRY